MFSGTEFLTKVTAQKYYPNQPLQFHYFINDMHRMNWTPGDWTGFFWSFSSILPQPTKERVVSMGFVLLAQTD
jgi:hypothetical protein